ncbi:MAG: thiamine diphosphokinase [Blautia sp.]|nr:thiamine diphosphokinase [Blautia sp.]
MYSFDTVIISGGNIQDDFALDFLGKARESAGSEGLRLIAADHGLDFFASHGMQPDLAIGDFDSAGSQELLHKLPEECVIRLPREKDDSDTEAALMLAIRQGAGRIAILGATGTRVDHMLANLGLLLRGRENGVFVTLLDPWNCMRLVAPGEILLKKEQFGKYVSFCALGCEVEGLTLTGFQYPLSDYHLSFRDCGRTISNEFRDETAKVEYRSGDLLMIQSRDEAMK